MDSNKKKLFVHCPEKLEGFTKTFMKAKQANIQ